MLKLVSTLYCTDAGLKNFTNTDWGTIGSNLGYFWGYGAPYLVAGQLDSPDPGCGVDDLYSAMNVAYKAKVGRQDILDRDRAMRTAVSCLESENVT